MPYAPQNDSKLLFDGKVKALRGAAMPLFFFDLNDLLDGIGKELPDRNAARGEARRLLSEALFGTDPTPGKFKNWSCVVRDSQNDSRTRIVVVSLVEMLNDESSNVRSFQPV